MQLGGGGLQLLGEVFALSQRFRLVSFLGCQTALQLPAALIKPLQLLILPFGRFEIFLVLCGQLSAFLLRSLQLCLEAGCVGLQCADLTLASDQARIRL